MLALRIAEPPDPLSEADLSRIWEGQRYPAGALSSHAGITVEVLNPGRRGGSAGPDFRDAVVRLDGREVRGDIELHVRASYYLQHGHHLDPAYDRVVLHVVFLDDAGGSSPLAGGGSVPVAAFAPWVESRAADIATWQAAPPLWREPCQTAVSRLGEAGVAAALRGAGQERLSARMHALAAAVDAEGPREALWQALLEALGYGGDREGFRRLARALPLSLLTEVLARHPGGKEAAARSALLAVAGLLAAPDLAGLPPALSPPLRNRSSRPANRAERRLAGAAALAAGAPLRLRAVKSVEEAPDASRLLAAWSRTGAIGRGRASELLLNAVLPFVAATRPDLADRCLELAAGLPAVAPYGKTAFLERNLTRQDGRRAVRGALDQQGLLAFHAQWCSQGGCGRCPLS